MYKRLFKTVSLGYPASLLGESHSVICWLVCC